MTLSQKVPFRAYVSSALECTWNYHMHIALARALLNFTTALHIGSRACLCSIARVDRYHGMNIGPWHAYSTMNSQQRYTCTVALHVPQRYGMRCNTIACNTSIACSLELSHVLQRYGMRCNYALQWDRMHLTTIACTSSSITCTATPSHGSGT